MTGRHASSRTTTPSPWLRRLGLSVAAVAVLGAAGLGTASVLDPAGGECSGSLPVAVAADPGIAPVLTELADQYAHTEPAAGDRCVEIDVTAAPAATVAATVGAAEAPHLWIPKSLAYGPAVDAAQVHELANVALSPLVVVLPRQAAQAAGGAEAEVSWAAVVQGDATAVLADPAVNDEGLASLLAVRAALDETLEQSELVALMTEVSRAAVATVDDAFATLAGATPAAFTATEQSVVAFNRTAPEVPANALYPSEGTFAFDYPALAVQGVEDDPDAASAAADFVTYLGSIDAQEAIRAAGFRSPDGTADDDAGVVDGIRPAMPELLPDPDPAAVTELTRQWAALSLEMRMLAVIDVSGSMNEQVEGGATRIELTRDAALEALGLFPPSSSIGLWAFSILQDPPNDHVELVDIGPMDEEAGDGTRLDALVGALESLPSRAEGGTGLYDTVLAAFQEVRGSYQAGSVNSVVLLTDGRNEDDPEGIDLETLLTTLTAQFDPANPVPVITIGMGPEADMDALQQISAATGTQAYQAEDPRDIQSVFVQAMIERQCRPNC
ncbi:substrate-binding domain-containing protein [Jiangella asiatica]|uniref:VWA domain-containing protein n=1 Tax=Jiangella asiatica TaxID=2530372 RepID=A0A4R5D7E9_9ACTN|nr:substrate-binding domain-containing protein [Jiangella asiatica]TDE09442.1 VWA domain-containing protein [Jiangella asiatica]